MTGDYGWGVAAVWGVCVCVCVLWKMAAPERRTGGPGAVREAPR